MVLFLDEPEQGLAGKIDGFAEICVILLTIATRRTISKAMFIIAVYFAFEVRDCFCVEVFLIPNIRRSGISLFV